ncbi:hypothetical protein, partial [Arthrobacter sp. Br18]|uniref:hypothetical protein n=1 Tax=Arthrobacter sp. Br18 TaxID=1312954 RepID=UPI000479B55D
MRVFPADTAFGAAALLGGALLWWSGTRIIAQGSSSSVAGIEEVLGLSFAVAGMCTLIWWLCAAAAAVAAQLLAAGGHGRAAAATA